MSGRERDEDLHLIVQNNKLANPQDFIRGVMFETSQFNGNTFSRAFGGASIEIAGMNDTQIPDLLKTISTYIEELTEKNDQWRDAVLVYDAVRELAYYRGLLPEDPIKVSWSSYKPGEQVES